MTRRFVAVDLGAASGRVMAGEVGPETLRLSEAHRFPNLPVRVAGTLHWDILAIHREVLDGLRAAGPADSIGVDAWGVDYGLLDASGALLGDPVHYRDGRTACGPAMVADEIPDRELYATTGLQFLPINTIYQLTAARGSVALDNAWTLLMIPDLVAYWLTGEIGAEVTIASTTGLLDARTRAWARPLLPRLGLPERILPPLRAPGDPAGELAADAREATGLPAVPVTAVASHDTASAVAAVPAASPRFGYISCGTWSLAGVELAAPVISEEGRAANFTNEAGVDGTVRYLRNVMGLWMLQESLRAWGVTELEPLLAAAARVPGLAAVVNPYAEEFLPPGDMPARIAEHCRATGQRPPDGPAETVRCVLDSLALGHRTALRAAVRLSGHPVDVVHIVGGGARNELLCRLTADACGLPVLAGPVEATALGNVLVQARVYGAVGGLPEMRALVAATHPPRRYEPSADETAWSAAAARVGLD